jgi:uncharacterized iron-regulated membrane protein
MFKPATIKTWYLTHKWTSLICTAFLLMSCLTGLPLIFHDELDDYFDRHVEPAPAAGEAQPASIDAMVALSKARHPRETLYWVGWDDDEPRVLVTMAPTPDSTPSAYHSLAFDANSGGFLDERKTRGGFTDFLLTLHENMFTGLPGELFLGLMALIFVAAVVSGAVVYGPFMRKLEFGTVRRARTRLAWFDLHNLLGILTVCWALVVGITGALNTIAVPLTSIWRAQELPRLLAPYRGKPPLTSLQPIDPVIEKVHRALPENIITSVVFPGIVRNSPRHYLVWTKGSTPITSRLFTPALVDAETGKIDLAKPVPWYLHALYVSRPLHFGDYGGMPLKIIWAALDAITIVVLGSGLYLWWARRREPDRTLESYETVISAPEGAL